MPSQKKRTVTPAGRKTAVDPKAGDIVSLANNDPRALEYLRQEINRLVARLESAPDVFGEMQEYAETWGDTGDNIIHLEAGVVMAQCALESARLMETAEEIRERFAPLLAKSGESVVLGKDGE